MCKRGDLSLLGNPVTGNVLLARSHCNNWDCPECAARFAERWMKHFCRLWFRLHHLYVFETDAATWRSCVVHRMIRAGVNYATVHLGGTVTVFCDTELPEFSQLHRREAIRMLETLLDGACGDRPIHTSLKWQMIRNEEMHELLAASGWKFFGVGISREAYREAAERMSLAVTHRNEGVFVHVNGITIEHFAQVCWLLERKLRSQLVNPCSKKKIGSPACNSGHYPRMMAAALALQARNNLPELACAG